MRRGAERRVDAGCDGERLGVSAGSLALRTIRRYRDADDRILILSKSVHPADRFAFEMRLDRQR